MDRMGKITMLVLAVAVLLMPVCLSDYSDVADGEGTDPILEDVSDELGECKVSMLTANTEADVLKWVKETWLKGINWTDSEKFGTLNLGTGYDSNLTVAKTANTTFKAAIAGTPSDKDGTEGELSFDITDANNNQGDCGL